MSSQQALELMLQLVYEGVKQIIAIKKE